MLSGSVKRWMIISSIVIISIASYIYDNSGSPFSVDAQIISKYFVPTSALQTPGEHGVTLKIYNNLVETKLTPQLWARVSEGDNITMFIKTGTLTGWIQVVSILDY